MNETIRKRDEKFGIILYVLELQNGKYYVGITSKPEERFQNHRIGKSQSFVKKNLPIINIQITKLETTDRNEALILETNRTIELINKYGIVNVCGGLITGELYDRMIKYRKYQSTNKNT